ncbi:hypothetical protein PFISCL1PPCAC_14680, partial [Pristionchus fissidentatus]
MLSTVFYSLVILQILPNLASSQQQIAVIKLENVNIDELCGAHPLKSVLDKISFHHSDASHDELVKVLAVLKFK